MYTNFYLVNIIKTVVSNFNYILVYSGVETRGNFII